jgi:hypothetical protein
MITQAEEDVVTLRAKVQAASDRAAAAAADLPNPDGGNEQLVRRHLQRVEGAANEERIMVERWVVTRKRAGMCLQDSRRELQHTADPTATCSMAPNV